METEFGGLYIALALDPNLATNLTIYPHPYLKHFEMCQELKMVSHYIMGISLISNGVDFFFHLFISLLQVCDFFVICCFCLVLHLNHIDTIIVIRKYVLCSRTSL